ncbi:MAG: putative signaling protein [Promethearchaeota archaeon CR_4]|nr:MAG: putative signaling protein [Candidatus Lokiarchaeota archaeon CR_4]
MIDKTIKVLLIEDDLSDARIIRKYLIDLRHITCTIYWVKSLADGLDALSREEYSIILLDLNLPDSRGLATVQGIMEHYSTIPVIILTGNDDERVAVEALQEGVGEYIVKNDLTSHLLINSVHNVIKRFRVRQELKQKNDELEDICKNFFNLVAMQADGVVVVDARGRIRYMNPVAMDLLDFQFDAIVHTPFMYDVMDDKVLDVEIHRKTKPPCSIEMRKKSFIWEGKQADLISIRDVTEQKRVEVLLRRNQVMLLEAQKIAHIGSWEHNVATGRETWSNEIFLIFGQDPLIGKTSPKDRKRNIHPEDWFKIDTAMQDAIKTGTPFNLEFRIIHPDGITHWGWIIGKVVSNEKGKVVKVYGTLQDITERKQAQESLQQSEGKYRFLVEQLNDIIYTSDTEGVVTFISPVVEAITGFAPKELLNRKLFYFYIKEDRPRLTQNFKRVLAGESFSEEYRILHKSGNLMWLRVNARPIFKGKILQGTQGVVTDITNQKLAEQALRESEARLKDAQSLGQIGSWEFDNKTRILKWSDQMYRLFERDPALGPFTKEEEASYTAPGQLPKIQELRRRAIEEGRSFKYDAEGILPSGKHIFLSAILQPMKDALGQFTILFGTVQDITERKRVEEELKFQNLLLSTQQETSIDGILVVNEKGKFLSFNKRFVDIWGIASDAIATSSDDSLLRSILDNFVNPNQYFERMQYLNAHHRETSQDEVTLKNDRKFEIYSAPMIGSDEKYYGRVWYFRDITERKRAEDAKRESE